MASAATTATPMSPTATTSAVSTSIASAAVVLAAAVGTRGVILSGIVLRREILRRGSVRIGLALVGCNGLSFVVTLGRLFRGGFLIARGCFFRHDALAFGVRLLTHFLFGNILWMNVFRRNLVVRNSGTCKRLTGEHFDATRWRW